MNSSTDLRLPFDIRPLTPVLGAETVENLDPSRHGDLLAPRKLLGVVPFSNKLRDRLQIVLLAHKGRPRQQIAISSNSGVRWIRLRV